MPFKKIAVAAVVIALAGSCFAFAGCSGTAESDASSAGVPPLMPAGHEGRYQNLGAEGCYGCHGASDKANPMLASASKLPSDHYDEGDEGTLALDPGRVECLTCHAQG